MTGQSVHSDMEDRKAKKRAAHKKWAEANPEKWATAKQRAALNGSYGPGAYEHFLRESEKQNGHCAVCGQPETMTYRGRVRNLCIDHNHETGALRGLLCHACNVMIGHARENAEILVAAQHYLAAHA